VCHATGNVWSHYSEKGNRIGSRKVGDRDRGDIIADITTSFVVLMGIFFPSVTGTAVSQSVSQPVGDERLVTVTVTAEFVVRLLQSA